MAGFAFPTVAPVVSSTVAYSPTLDYAGVLAEDEYAAWVLGEQALAHDAQARSRSLVTSRSLTLLIRITGPLGIANSSQTFLGGIVLALSFSLYYQKGHRLQPEGKAFLITANVFNFANVVLSILCSYVRETSREYPPLRSRSPLSRSLRRQGGLFGPLCSLYSRPYYHHLRPHRGCKLSLPVVGGIESKMTNVIRPDALLEELDGHLEVHALRVFAASYAGARSSDRTVLLCAAVAARECMCFSCDTLPALTFPLPLLRTVSARPVLGRYCALSSHRHRSSRSSTVYRSQLCE